MCSFKIESQKLSDFVDRLFLTIGRGFFPVEAIRAGVNFKFTISGLFFIIKKSPGVLGHPGKPCLRHSVISQRTIKAPAITKKSSSIGGQFVFSFLFLTPFKCLPVFCNCDPFNECFSPPPPFQRPYGTPFFADLIFPPVAVDHFPRYPRWEFPRHSANFIYYLPRCEISSRCSIFRPCGLVNPQVSFPF